VNSGGLARGRILVIEDDRDIALGIRTVLAYSGYEVARSPDGKQGLRDFHATRPDLVVLDIGLPALDGWAVLERIRDLSDVPILILTAYGCEADKVRGLRGGADDYLTKPFGNRELAARVEALLRRPRAGQAHTVVYDDGSLVVKFESHEVSVDGVPVTLTPIEFRLLAALIRHPGQTLTSDQLLRLVWNDPLGIGPDRVKFGIMRLRRKLGQASGPGSAIEAVRGFGYRYADRRPAGEVPRLPGTARGSLRGMSGMSGM
jgi:DNA-binding response OmpR family regulator